MEEDTYLETYRRMLKFVGERDIELLVAWIDEQIKFREVDQ